MKTAAGSCQKYGKDDIFHIDGEVQVCPRDMQYEHFHALRPLLDVVGKNKTLLMAPMPRYIMSGCCNNRRHTTNREDPYFKEDMYTQLEALKRNLKEYIHNLNKKNLKVMDPNMDLRGMDPADIWGDNPITPLDMAADKLVDGLLLMASHLNNNAGNSGNHPRGRGRGRGGRVWDDQRMHRDQDYSGGRPHNPGMSSGGQGHRGGPRDYRAKPY
jgi:hypothetical protein